MLCNLNWRPPGSRRPGRRCVLGPCPRAEALPSVANQFGGSERVISSVNVSEPNPGKRVRMCPKNGYLWELDKSDYSPQIFNNEKESDNHFIFGFSDISIDGYIDRERERSLSIPVILLIVYATIGVRILLEKKDRWLNSNFSVRLFGIWNK